MAKKKETNLDEQLVKLIKYVESWEESLSEHLVQQETDSRYYHGKQWTNAEIEDLNKRGQPVVINNEIKKKINSVCGHEIRSRKDPIAEPRTQKHSEEADVATDCLRYIDQNTKLDRKFTASTLDVLKVGVGAIITQVNQETMEIENTQIPWNRVFYDPHSRLPDFSDALYMGVIQYREKSDLLSDPQYKESKHLIEDIQSYESEGMSITPITDERPRGWYDTARKRIRVIEIYYKEPTQPVEIDGKMQTLTGPVWKVAHFVKRGFLIKPICVDYYDYEDYQGIGIIRNINPMTLVSGYVNDDNCRYGIVRDLRSPQDIINKTTSKILYELSVDSGYAERGAFPDPDEFVAQNSQPDQIAMLNDGALKDGKFVPKTGNEKASGYMQLKVDAQQHIDNIGPSSSMMGLGPTPQSGMSGKLFIAQQQQATMELGLLFDNLADFRLTVYRKEWILIRQFWTAEKMLRIRDDKDLQTGYRFTIVNREKPKIEHYFEMMESGMDPQAALLHLFEEDELDAAMEEISAEIQSSRAFAQATMAARRQGQEIDPERMQSMIFEKFIDSDYMKQPYIMNNIANLDVDIIIDEKPESTIVEHEEFQSLIGLAQQLPAFAQLPISFWIKASGLRGDTKKDLIQMTEQSKPSEEEMQAQQQQIQMQMQMMQAQIEKLMAEVQKTQADAMKSQAQAQQIAGEAQLSPVKAQSEIYKNQSTGMNQQAQAAVHASDAKTNPYGGKSE